MEMFCSLIQKFVFYLGEDSSWTFLLKGNCTEMNCELRFQILLVLKVDMLNPVYVILADLAVMALFWDSAGSENVN
jgi:hypothetical protein